MKTGSGCSLVSSTLISTWSASKRATIELKIDMTISKRILHRQEQRLQRPDLGQDHV